MILLNTAYKFHCRGNLHTVADNRDTKLSIAVVLLGVAICTVTDVSVNAKGFIAAVNPTEFHIKLTFIPTIEKFANSINFRRSGRGR